MQNKPLIYWKTPNGEKYIFNNSDIDSMSRNHALALFSNAVPVLAIENGINIVNDPATRDKLLAQRKKVMLFSECKPSEELFKNVGFTGKLQEGGP